jgi:hypothetical protein
MFRYPRRVIASSFFFRISFFFGSVYLPPGTKPPRGPPATIPGTVINCPQPPGTQIFTGYAQVCAGRAA